MSKRAGRNDPCPCGSGQKMKNCHPKGYGKSSPNRNIVIIGSAAVVLLIVVVALVQDDTAAPVRNMPVTTSIPSQGNTAQQPATRQGGGTPQPGPAPEGKVWSEEHGHWHDAPGTANPQVQGGAQSNFQPKPQPPGPAPEGKVWSEEHGHWHDAPATATPQASGQSIQQEPADAAAQEDGSSP